MKDRSREQKLLFTLLIWASLIAVGVGGYLGIALGTAMPGVTRILPVIGIVLWAVVWGEFLALCLRLRKGQSAFTPTTGKMLGVISKCMVGLALVTAVAALVGGSRLNTGFWVIELVLLPCFFLAVSVAAKILQGLLVHAMAIEKEQEGVV